METVGRRSSRAKKKTRLKRRGRRGRFDSDTCAAHGRRGVLPLWLVSLCRLNVVAIN